MAVPGKLLVARSYSRSRRQDKPAHSSRRGTARIGLHVDRDVLDGWTARLVKTGLTSSQFAAAKAVLGAARAYRRTLIGMLISGEIIFAAASLNFMAVNRFFAPDPVAGQIFVLFIMGLAAAEVAIALSIIIAVYRNYRSIASGELSELKG